MRDDDFTEDELQAAAAKDEAPQPEAEAKDGAPEGEAEPVAEKPEGEAEPAPDDAKVKTVPHEALHAERLARRRIEQELAAEREARTRERERLDKIEAMLRGKPEGEPVADEDPIAVLKSLQQGQAAILETQQQREAREREAAEEAFVLQTLVQSEAQFKAVKRDYDAAAEFLWQSRVREFQLWGLTAEEAEASTRAEIGQWSRRALMDGRSPAELFYGLAESRGYRAAAPQPAPAAVQPSGVEKVAALKQVQQQSRSLSAAAGAAPAGDVNIRALLDMDDDEFASTIGKVQFRKVAGG